MMKTPRMLAALVASALFAIAGCGGGGDDSGGTPQAEKATQAKASGDVTWCIGKDTTGSFSTVVDNFNKANPKANAKLIELPTSADDQRRLQVQRLRAKSSECDVLGMDVIWTAEYAAQGWLKDVSDYISQNGD
jgi:multiple sugar transport system substrate-binding protein